MTRRQKWIVVAVIVLPSLIGLFLTGMGSGDEDLAGGWMTSATKRIGLVRVTDVIFDSERYVDQLRSLRDDKSIAGVILRINSPGGAVAPSQEIYAEVKRFRDAGKPLIVSMENIAASGGYYIAAAAQKIYADPGTLTGSFGVYMRFPHYYKLAEKVGLDWTTIKAGRFKDVGNPNRAMTDEERDLLQGVIDDTHQQFISDIATGRAMNIDSVRAVADGRIFTGRQAQALGLVDSLGGYEDAVTYLKDYLNVSQKTRVVEKKPREGLWQSLLGGALESIPPLRALVAPAGAYFVCDGLR